MKQFNVTAMDVGKRLLDFGLTRHDLFSFARSRMLFDRAYRNRIQTRIKSVCNGYGKNPNTSKRKSNALYNAPHHLSHQRLDDVKAVRELDLIRKVNHHYL